ncbi:MAG: DNA-processing protein DprA [bacterium]
MASGEEIRDWVALNMVDGIGGVKIMRLLLRFGSPRRILDASIDELQCVEGIGPKLARAVKSIDYRLVDRELALIERYNINVLPITHPSFPPSLKGIPTPPPCLLYVLGEILPGDERAIAIVGSRGAPQHHRKISFRFAEELAGMGFTVVSGMARGIDAASHSGALSAGGRTLAVMGCGLSHAYPPENRELMRKVIRQGALISEFPMATKPIRQNFPRRNRIISGLSLGVVIVGAADDSGALITADFAIEQGKEVFAVPGDIHDKYARGAHKIIKERGVKLVENVSDILEELKYKLDYPSPVPSGEEFLKRPPVEIPLSADEEAIYRHLSFEGTHVDEIAALSQKPVSQVLSILTMLEMKGVVSQLAGKIFVRN